MEVLEQVPKTALDVFRLLPEGTLCEVFDNVLYMSRTPTFTHQRVLMQIHSKLFDYSEKTGIGEFVHFTDVYFDDLLSAVQPDILFISNGNRHIIKDDDHIHGTPDLIIEVLSFDEERDTVMKKDLYGKAGVKEYFIVNPASRRIQAYSLHEGSFQIMYEADGVFTSTLLQLEFTF